LSSIIVEGQNCVNPAVVEGLDHTVTFRVLLVVTPDEFKVRFIDEDHLRLLSEEDLEIKGKEPLGLRIADGYHRRVEPEERRIGVLDGGKGLGTLKGTVPT